MNVMKITELFSRISTSPEETEAIGNRFENAFRTGESWAIGECAASRERDTERMNVLGGSFSKDGNRGNAK